MNVLLIGGGGREHALAWKIAQSRSVDTLFAAPGNPGIAALPKCACVALDPLDFPAVCAFVDKHDIGLTVVGPEDPLAAGIVDALEAAGHRAFGPSKAAAQLEASKAFAKAFMVRHGIPTAAYARFDEAAAAHAYIDAAGAPLVVKADGLAAGKGVTVCHDAEAAHWAVDAAMVDGVFGEAGRAVVIEEFLEGEEASLLAFCDGARAVPMASAQDHKAVFDGDRGPNTGGMGAYSPAPVVTRAMMESIQRDVLDAAVRGMAAEGTPYRGVLYAGLMITAAGPKVIEFNCRFGDPETQVVLPRMATDLVPVLEACCAGTLDPAAIRYSDYPCVSVVMASGGYPGSYPKGLPIAGIDHAQTREGVLVFHAGTRLDDGAVLTNGGRVLNVTATAPSLPAAIAKAYDAVRAIHFDGAHYRNDIGQKALKHLPRA